jgi:hypothetical protein
MALQVLRRQANWRKRFCLSKKDHTGETKEQRKHRKARERMGLSLSDQKRYVFCLKWGTKYGPEYVNKLYNMVQRNTTLDYEFICLTENKTGLDPHINISVA